MLDIKKEDINKGIQILNYKNDKQKREREKNIEILLDDRKIDYNWKYKFNEENKYKISIRSKIP